MAYIEPRKNDRGEVVGFLVVYRPADTNLRKSRFIAVAKPKPGTVGYGEDDEHPWTRADLEEAARARAESIAEEMRQKERAYRKPLERVARWSKEDGWEPIFSHVP